MERTTPHGRVFHPDLEAFEMGEHEDNEVKRENEGEDGRKDRKKGDVGELRK